MASYQFDDDDDDRTVFLSATLNSERHSWQILAQFLENLDYENGSWFIQHDGATDLVARNSVTALRNFYVNRIITSSFVVCPFTRFNITWLTCVCGGGVWTTAHVERVHTVRVRSKRNHQVGYKVSPIFRQKLKKLVLIICFVRCLRDRRYFLHTL